MDWQTLVGRRASKAAPAKGGWNMFFTTWVGADMFNPLVNNMVNGRGARAAGSAGRTSPRLEELRDAYAEASRRGAEEDRRGDSEARL